MKSGGEQTIPVLDKFFSAVDLPLTATYYPAGFPLHLATNASDVLESAHECWGSWAAEFERPPVKIRVVVQAEGGLGPPSSFRRYGHLFGIVSDADNFALADLKSMEGCIFVSARTAADHAWLRWFFLEALAYCLLGQQYVVPVHAACVSRGGCGFLLCGVSGAGKSTLSFACARAGWTFISDDATWLLPDSAEPAAIGRPYQARFRRETTQLFPELAGFSDRERPNGKVSLEVPLEELPEIRTGLRCRIGGLVMLDREDGGAARAEAIDPERIVELLWRDEVSWGEEADALHLRAIQRLAKVPAWRLCYAAPEDGVRLLETLTGR